MIVVTNLFCRHKTILNRAMNILMFYGLQFLISLLQKNRHPQDMHNPFTLFLKFMEAKWKSFSVRRAVRLYCISPIAVYRMPYLTIYNKILFVKATVHRF